MTTIYNLTDQDMRTYGERRWALGEPPTETKPRRN